MAVVTVAPGEAPSAVLSGITSAGRTVSVVVTVDGTVDGSGVRTALIGRYLDNRHQYRVRVRLRADTSATVGIYKMVGSFEEQVLAERFVALRAGQPFVMAMHIDQEGTSVRMFGAAWTQSELPPDAWQLVATDGEPALAADLSIGISTYVPPDVSAAITTRWDDVRVS